MWNASDFKHLVSGRRRGPQAFALRSLLRLAETPYALAMRLRNRRYDRNPARVAHVGVPVVSVGNLTLGGTGKTPLVAWLARWFRAANVRVAIVSRGYGAEKMGRNDEAVELEERLPDVPHLQDPDRVAAAQVAIEELDMELILLDDGFQHRRLGRDLDIVLIDALEPFGFGHVFPRGTLREPATGLARADVVILSRSDAIDATARQALQTEIHRLAPRSLYCEIVHRPEFLRNGLGELQRVETLRAHPIVACCGIGNPAGFRHTLEQCGYDVRDLREFPDHYGYGRDDIESLTAWARDAGAEAVVTTHKDLVKLRLPRLGPIPLWALTIGAEFVSGEQELTARLARLTNGTDPFLQK